MFVCIHSIIKGRLNHKPFLMLCVCNLMKALVKYYIHTSVWSGVSWDKHYRRLSACLSLWGNFCLYVFLNGANGNIICRPTQLPDQCVLFSEYTLSSLIIVKDFAKWYCRDGNPHPQPFCFHFYCRSHCSKKNKKNVFDSFLNVIFYCF